MLDRTSVVPLYCQLREVLRQKITDGSLKPGQFLPSEPEISRQYGVSRQTTRQAFADLVREGIVTRQRGIGTCVVDNRAKQNLMRFPISTRDIQTKELNSPAVLITFEVVVTPACTTAAKFFDDTLLKTKGFYHITRLCFLAGEPFLLENSYLPCLLFPGLIEEDLVTRPLNDLIENRFGWTIEHSEEYLEPVRVVPGEAALFDLRLGALALRITHATYSGGQPVEWHESIIPSERYRFHSKINDKQLPEQPQITDWEVQPGQVARVAGD